MTTNWKQIDRMSRMSPEQFQKYDTGLRDKEQAAKQRETTRAAEQWLSGANKVNQPSSQERVLTREEAEAMSREQSLNQARIMMQEDQFRMIAARKGLSPATIDYMLKNKVPAFFSRGLYSYDLASPYHPQRSPHLSP